jgi:signal transduction histidine kinase
VDPGLRHSESEVRILAAIREHLRATLTLDEVVEGALRVGAGAVQADASSLVLRESEGAYRKFCFVAAEGAQRVEQIHLSPGEGLVGYVIATGVPVEVPDLALDTRFTERVDAICGIRAGALACVPLRVGEESLGVLEVAKKDAGSLSDTGFAALLSIAGPLAIMVAHARVLSEIKGLHEKLELANRAKAQFLATTSHELRTPMNIIIGNLDLLLDGFLGEMSSRQKESLRTALRNSGEALNLITSLLDLSRIEAGQVVIRVEEFRLDEVWKELELLFRIGLSGKEVELVWAPEEGLPSLKTDKVKVKEILSNIIFNAVKYTYQGKIEVTAAPMGGGSTVQIEVADTGVGIPSEYLSLIFEPFRQVEGVSVGAQGGVGLGLSIARRLLELLHGQIEIESEVGKGSTFRITLPTSYSA